MQRISIILIAVILSKSFVLNAQEVIATSGKCSETLSGSLSWTLGETVIGKGEQGGTILTQGFQQPQFIILTDFSFDENQHDSFTAFPNPAGEFVILHSQNSEKLSYELIHSNGSCLLKGKMNTDITHISFSGLSASTYFLRILYKNQTIKTFKIIKK